MINILLIQINSIVNIQLVLLQRNTDQQQQRYYDQSKVGNVTLYPTPEGYMLGPHSVTVSQERSHLFMQMYLHHNH